MTIIYFLGNTTNQISRVLILHIHLRVVIAVYYIDFACHYLPHSLSVMIEVYMYHQPPHSLPVAITVYFRDPIFLIAQYNKSMNEI